jgi:signal peptidase I
MTDHSRHNANRRGAWARIGIVALNLPAPGLGLLRVNDGPAAAAFLLAPFALIALVTLGVGYFPITSYTHALIALVTILVPFALLYLGSAIRSWRKSQFRRELPIWSRWYGILVIGILMSTAAQLATAIAHSFYKPFYAPSASMAPTIGKGDKFIVDMRWHGPFRRGDIIVFREPDSVRVSRIAAIAGDRIAMRAGLPIVNGIASSQMPKDRITFVGYSGLQTGLVLAERLPGEPSTHQVLNTGPSEFDNTAEVIIPANHLFVLGDNRELSADSRVPADEAGVGMVAETAVMGRPMYIHWSSDRAKIGTRLDM